MNSSESYSLAAHRYGLMVQTYERVVIAMIAQQLAQLFQLLGADAAGGVVGHPGAEHHYQPAAELGVAADLERSAAQR
jgi:hypothetical protein